MSCTLLIDLGLQSVDLIADDPDLLLLRVKLIDLLLVQLAPEPPLKFVELQRCKLLEVGEVYFACGRLRCGALFSNESAPGSQMGQQKLMLSNTHFSVFHNQAGVPILAMFLM